MNKQGKHETSQLLKNSFAEKVSYMNIKNARSSESTQVT